MDFRGIPITDGGTENLQIQIDSLDDRVTLLEEEDVIINNTLNKLNAHAVYTGSNTFVNSNTLTDLTPPTGILGSLHIPIEDCQDGMVVKITVFGELALDPAKGFRLYLDQDGSGNFPWTSVTYIPMSTNDGATYYPVSYTFTIIFKSISPLSVYSQTYSQWTNRVLYSTGSLNSITSTGAIFYIMGQFDANGGDIGFKMNNFILERLPPIR
jgi:hypothetical protein